MKLTLFSQYPAAFVNFLCDPSRIFQISPQKRNN